MQAEPESNPPRRRSPYGIYAYTAREWDPEVNLYYYRFRYYDPEAGRFISEDPIGFAGGLNLYGYVGGRPLNAVDPFGLLDPTGFTAGIGAAQVAAGAGAGAGGLVLAGVVGGVVGVIVVVNVVTGGVPPDAEPNPQPAPPPPDPTTNPTTTTADGSPSRTIPHPKRPRCGCTCTCRADADDTMPGNVKPGMSRFAFGTATASNCAKAAKAAKRAATRNLGMKPKHIGCKCVGK